MVHTKINCEVLKNIYQFDDRGRILHGFDDGDVGWLEGVKGINSRLECRDGFSQVTFAVVLDGLGGGSSLVG